MMLIITYLYPWFLGFLILSTLLCNVPLRFRVLFYAAASFPVGLGVCSLIHFAAYLISPPAAGSISWFASWGVFALVLVYCIACLHAKRCLRGPSAPVAAPSPSLSSGEKIAGVSALAVFVLTLIGTVYFYPQLTRSDIFIYGSGDARFIWALKAKFFFRAPEAWQNMFSQQLFWSHTDYPLLVPGALAWGWNWTGREEVFWAPLVFFSFYLSCAGILVWYLSARICRGVGWLGGAFFLVLAPYLHNAVHQFADVPATFFITSCGLTLVTALRSQQGRIHAVAGFLGGLAAWTKNEGLFFVAWAYLFLVVICAGRLLRRESDPLQPLRAFTLGALLPLIAVIILKCFLGTQGEYLGSGRTLQDYQRLLFAGWPKSYAVLKFFFMEMFRWDSWQGLWGLFVIALMVVGFRNRRTKEGYPWVLPGLVLLINAGYVLIYHITPHDMMWHIQTSLNRLILHSGLLALAFTFESLGMMPSRGPCSPQG